VYTADFQKAGLLPLRDHSKDVELWFRTVRYAALVEGRDDETNAYLYGEDSVGDVNCALLFKKDGEKRPISGWAYAWPVTAGIGEAATADTTTGGSGGVKGPSGAVPPGGGGAPITGVPGVVTPMGAGTRTGKPDIPIDMVPIYRDYKSDARFSSLNVHTPDTWPIFPLGWAGVGIAGTRETTQEPHFLPTDPRLVSVHRGGHPWMSSLVCDITKRGAVDSSAISPLHSHLVVLKNISGVVPFGPRNHLAWMLDTARQDSTAGLGLMYDRVDGAASSATPRVPEVTNPYGPPTPTATSQPILAGPSGAIPSAGGGAGGVGALSAMAAPPRGSEGVSCASWQVYGPFHPGHGQDKHILGKTGDGENVTSAHVWTRALHYMDRDYDGPLEYQRKPYPKPGQLPIITRVHLKFDHTKTHPWTAGAKSGEWRWHGEAPMGGGDRRVPNYTTPPTENKPPQETTPPSDVPPSKPPELTPPTGPGDAPPVDNRPRGGDGGMHGAGTMTGIFNYPSAYDPYPLSPGGGSQGGLALLRGEGNGKWFPGRQPPLASHFVPAADNPKPPFPLKPWDPADRANGFVDGPIMLGTPGLLFRPQSMVRGVNDLRHTSSAAPEHVQQDRPISMRVEAWAKQTGHAWGYTQRRGSGKWVAGTANGGITYLPPEVDMADEGTSYAPGHVTRSTGYVNYGPGVWSSWALPSTATGAVKSGARMGLSGGEVLLQGVNASGTAATGIALSTDGEVAIRNGLAMDHTLLDNSDSPYPLATDDLVILVDLSAGNVEIRLDAVATVPGRYLNVKIVDTGGGNLTLTPNGAETIDGAAPLVSGTLYESFTLYAGPSEWSIL
jgi:hypothetical protein